MPTGKWEVFADGFAGENINKANIVRAVWHKVRMVLCMCPTITLGKIWRITYPGK
jgi:hypothetical protein